MRVHVALMAAGLLLTGCTLDLRGTEWKKPGAMFQDVSLVEESRQANAFGDCMTSAGYQRSG